MKFPEAYIEQVRTSTDIVEVVGEVVQLQRRGKSFTGLCPFHNEKTPSFHVTPEMGIYKCFGCGKGGNVFSFLTDYHKLTFLEAVTSLAHRAGIPLPDIEESRGNEEVSTFEQIQQCLRLAGNFYYKKLLEPVGNTALEYLLRRGFTHDIIRQFGIGYAPERWEETLDFLRSEGITDEILVESGIAGLSENSGKIYDRFRGRVMFPIQNFMGKVIGFGGRTLSTEKNIAKYINSPQTKIYDKSKTLYGIFQSKDEIRRTQKAILVEGYADAIAVYQAGFRNVVASSGTALTREQLKLLARYCKTIVIMYDGDTAGINATLRGLEIALEEGFEVFIGSLSGGNDPDSYIREYGEKAFGEEIKRAKSFLDYKITFLIENGAFDTPESKARALRSVVESVAKTTDALVRDFMLQEIAQKFSMPIEMLYTELQKFSVRSNEKNFSNTTGKSSGKSENSTEKKIAATGSKTGEATSEVLYNAVNKIQYLKHEKALLEILAQLPDACTYVDKKYGITSRDFSNMQVGKIFEILNTAANSGQKLTDLLSLNDSIDLEYRDEIAGLMMPRKTASEKWRDREIEVIVDVRKEVDDCVIALQLTKLYTEKSQFEQVLRQPDIEIIHQMQVLTSLSEIQKKIREIEVHRRGIED